MLRFIATILLVSLAPWGSEARESAPSVSVRIPRAGIDGFIDAVEERVQPYAMKTPALEFTFPEQDGVSLEVTDVRFIQFDRPKITYQLQEPNKLLAKMTLPKLVSKGAVRARRTIQLPITSKTKEDAGTLEFTATDITLQMTIATGQLNGGAPIFNQSACDVDLGPAKVEAQGLREKFAIEAFSAASKTVRVSFSSLLCNTLNEALVGHANSFLRWFPNVIEIGGPVAVKMLIQPAMTKDHLQLNATEKLLTDRVHPWSPVECDMKVDGNPQAIATVSDALLNNLLEQSYYAGFLNFSLSPSSPPLLYKVISLDCGKSGACLGNVDKKLPERFGKDALVELEMEASVAPTLAFKDGKATVTAGWRFTSYITPNREGAKRTRVASGVVPVSGSLQLRFTESTAYAKVTVEDVQLKVAQPELKHWEKDARNLFKDLVQAYVNGPLLQKGLPVKALAALKVDNASIKFFKNCMQATGSWNYKVAWPEKD